MQIVDSDWFSEDGIGKYLSCKSLKNKDLFILSHLSYKNLTDFHYVIKPELCEQFEQQEDIS